jgi:predicted Rossmann fold nucleotide-binding protein DprA/Smf involved in DNA uptake
VDQAGEAFTRQVAELCAYNRMPVVSGGARGVDQISMNAALEAGGVTIGILAENLLKKSIERSARNAIANGRLLLLSPYHPNARFTVGTAMGRNKLIYAMSDYGLVVSAEHKKGGTWAGAEEELKRENALPVFVRIGNDIPPGNSKLRDLGAISWPDSIDRNNFKQRLQDLAVNSRDNRPKKNPSLFDFQAAQEAAPSEERPLSTGVVEEKPTIAESESVVEPEDKIPECPESIYQAVLPVILKKLDTPATAEELAETLDVNKTQINAWLKKVVEDGYVKKLSRPVRYIGLKNEFAQQGAAPDDKSVTLRCRYAPLPSVSLVDIAATDSQRH